MKKFLLFTAPIISMLLLWEFLSRSGLISIALFPPPSKVFMALWEMVVSGTLFSDLISSMWRLFLGLVCGSTIGILTGLLTGRKKVFDRALSPIIHVFRSFPPVALIPLVIVWFGIGDGAKIFSIALAVFFPVWLNTDIGVRSLPNEFLWSARLLTKSLYKIFREVIFPSSLPFIIAGIRTGIAIAFVMVFVSELSGASSGLGYRISITSLAYRIDQMIAALIVLGIFGAITDALFVCAANKIFPWIKLSTK